MKLSKPAEYRIWFRRVWEVWIQMGQPPRKELHANYCFRIVNVQ